MACAHGPPGFGSHQCHWWSEGQSQRAEDPRQNSLERDRLRGDRCAGRFHRLRFGVFKCAVLSLRDTQYQFVRYSERVSTARPGRHGQNSSGNAAGLRFRCEGAGCAKPDPHGSRPIGLSAGASCCAAYADNSRFAGWDMETLPAGHCRTAGPRLSRRSFIDAQQRP